jgi:putative redox protein
MLKISVRILSKFVDKVIKKHKKMKDAINVKWMGDMAFEAALQEHKLVMDAREETGGHNQGPRPKPLMMVSLAGCTGMDVVSILKKMKVDLVGFNVRVEGDIADEHPKLFTSMHIIYEFSGENLPIEKLTRAVELSQEKYCGVNATLKKAMPITWEIKIH